MSLRLLSLSACLLASSGAALSAASDDLAEKAVALLDERCFKCHSHSAGKNKGGLVMDSLAGLTTGGDAGAALVPGDPDASLFLKNILSSDPDEMMPPKGDRLTKEEVSLLQTWVKSGAAWPKSRTKAPVAGRYLPGTIGAKEKAWWAYQPVKRAELPAGAAAHPVDRFIDARLAKEGLTPSGEAERAVLIRRVTFDLTGLPPSPEEVAAFVQDQDPAAYDKLVDRLLASPAYGQRMARAWLDLVRYADSDGFRIDDFRPTAWRYRDYVIKAYNDNKPYDRFVQEQIAGDELFPGDPDALTALGYLRHWIYEYNNRDARGQWENILNDITDTTGDVFLGAGMQCARCHDHKFDPILQKDYFALRAFFEGVLWRSDLKLATPVEGVSHAAKQAAWETATTSIRAEIELLVGPARDSAVRKAHEKFTDDLQAILDKPFASRTPHERVLAVLCERQLEYEIERYEPQKALKTSETKARYATLLAELKKFDALKPAPLPDAFVATDAGRASPPTIMKGRRGGEREVAPGFLTLIAPEAAGPLADALEATWRRDPSLYYEDGFQELADRGGDVTYHGPGQRVAYVMLDLKRRGPDVRRFVATLEECIIHTLAAFNVRGERREDRVGVWVRRPEKGEGFIALADIQTPENVIRLAAPKNIEEFEVRRAELEKAAQEKLSIAQARAEKINELELTVNTAAGDEGKLFGSVGVRDLADLITAAGIEVAKHEVRLPNGPIRTVGEFEIDVQLHAEVHATLHLIVAAE